MECEKKFFIRFTMSVFCELVFFGISFFPFWLLGHDVGSECNISF